MAFKPLNKLFRPWLSSYDQTTVNYSLNSLYKCMDVTANQCLPSIVYNSEQYVNFCGPVISSRQCWSQLTDSQLIGNNDLNNNLMNFLMKARTKWPTNPMPVNSQYISETTNSVSNGSTERSAVSSDRVWFRKYRRQRPKRFSCPHCQIAFSNNGQLNGHIRTHTGERPFVCDHSDCGKSFTRNEELTRHRRIHTGVRPYSCVVCAKRFGRKDHLKKHQRTHEKRIYSMASNSITLQSIPQTTTSSSSSTSSNSLSAFYNSMYFQIRHQF